MLCTFGIIRGAQVPFTLEDGFYLLTSAEDLVKLSELSNDVTTYDDVGSASFRVTQDIDMSSIGNFTPICFTSSNGSAFKGTFDGGGHTISNVTISTSETNNNHLGFIGLLFSGTLRNLCLKNVTINNNSATAVARGALVGRDGSATIENCCVIDFTFNDQAAASSGTTTAGAVVGYLSSSASSIFKNNYAINATRVLEGTPILLPSFGGKGANATEIRNNYDDINTEAEDFASGKICYLLNGSQSDAPVWYQTIGTDASPVLDSTHGIVYLANDLTCDGQPKGENSYSNSGLGTRDEHQFADGVCSVCGTADEAWMQPVDNVYQIETPKQLVWFAAYVKSNNKAAACLTTDIDMNSVGEYKPIGTEAAPYQGTFDGQGHRILNLHIEGGSNLGLFGFVSGGATIENLIFDHSCYVIGESYVGVIGASTGEGTVTLKGIGNEADISASYRNAGGIIGCNLGSTAKFVIEDCYNTGFISGEIECAALSGWVGSGATITNCYNIGTVTGFDDETLYLYRGSATMKKVFSTLGTQGTIIENGDVASGNLTWMLNGESFLSPRWFQNLGDDPRPVLDATHHIVYKTDDTFADVGNDDSYPTFKALIISQEKEYCEETLATQSLLDEYLAAVNGWNDIATLDEFLTAYAQTKSLHDAIAASARDYQSYVQACNEMREQIKSLEVQNSHFYFLEDYLDEGNEIAPGDYPNGNSTYILSTHTLTSEELAEEKAYLEKLFLRVVLANPDAGSDMTIVMNNPDFVSSFSGWTNEGTAEMVHGGVTEILHVVRGMSGPFTTYQTLTDLPNGIYELRMNAFTRTGNDVSSKLYTSFLFMNDVANHIMAVGEDPVWEEDVVDGVNCHITGSSLDATYFNEESGATGYVPSYLVGCSYAYNVDRYVNRVAVEVTDGKLTLGVRDLASSLVNWTPFAKARLYYLGTAEEANDSLTLVLGDFVARATTIRDFIFDAGSDYTIRPNVSSELLQQVSAAIDESKTATTGAQKMALIKRMSELFNKVYACRMAYIKMLQAAERLEDFATKLKIRDLLSEDDMNAVFAATKAAWDAFENGTVSEEGAGELITTLEQFYGNIALPVDEEGTYHLSTGHHLAIFSALVNEGEIKARAVVDADIDMSAEGDFTPIGYTSANGNAFQGHLDGQGHTISNVTITADADNTNHLGFIGLLYTGTVVNLTLKDLTINNYSLTAVARGGLVGRDGSGTIRNCSVLNYTFNDQPVVEISTTATGGIVGYLSSSTSSVCENNYAYHCNRIVEGASTILPIYGNKGSSASNVTNNYDSRRTTDEQFASGEITYLLNGEQSTNPVWFQTLGVDEYPVLSKDSKVVYQLEDGTYSNDPAPTIEYTAPDADVLDVVFHEDGTAEDVSPLHNTVELVGETTSTYYNETYGRYVARFENPWAGTCTGYYKVDYEANEPVRSALADGHTLEIVVMGDFDGTVPDAEAKPFSAMQSGGTGFLICKTDAAGSGGKNVFTFLPNVTTTGSSTWRWVTSGVVPQTKTYYHVVGVWNQEKGKTYIYVDGVLCNTVDAPGNFRFANEGCNWLCLGGDPANASKANAGWKGDIVVARVYDKPLVEGEVEALWKKLNDGTSIANIRDGKTTNGYIYDLSGRRVEKPVKGLYIIDGRKVFVK